MDIRNLTDSYAVAPQITPDELPQARAQGFSTLICNRPDEEVTPDLASDAMRRAAEAAGLRFVMNPVHNGALSEANVSDQSRAIRAADGPVLAYCRSGTRSTVVWALGQAGERPTDEILRRAAEAGYPLDGLRPQIEARGKAEG